MHAAFSPLIGQPQAIELLIRAVQQDRIAPAYLFAGASGVGRSLAAKCFAELLLAPPMLVSQAAALSSQAPLNAQRSWDPQILSTLRQRIQQRNHPDLFWVEPTYLHQGKRLSAAEAAELGVKRRSPPEIRLEQIREVSRFLGRPPLEAARSVVVVEQAETMAEAAANGLLKTLEEPGQATIILIAPSAELLLPTLVSRCQRIPFQRLDAESINQVLTQVDRIEILQNPDLLALAQGSPGEAIFHWQQLQAIPPELITAVTRVPHSLRQALELAQQISQSLDAEAQLWLVDYLQHHYWQARLPFVLQHLENARRYLLQFVQPRLVWEVTLNRIRQDCQIAQQN